MAPLRQAHCWAVTHHDVVEHPDVHQRQGIAQPGGDGDIGPAGLGHATGVVVGKDHGRCIVGQRGLYHLAGVHAGAVQCAGEQFLVGNQTVARVQKQRRKHLAPPVTQLRGEVACRRLGLVHQVVDRTQLGVQVPAGHFQHRLQLHVLGIPQALAGAEGLAVGGQQRAQAAEVVEQLLGQCHGRCAGHARAQEDGQQFGIGQRARAAGKQLFARSLVGRPIADGHGDIVAQTGAARPELLRRDTI